MLLRFHCFAMGYDVVVASLVSGAKCAKLQENGCRYQLHEVDKDEVFNAEHAVLDAVTGLDKTVAYIADPQVRLVTLTITRHGYTQQVPRKSAPRSLEGCYFAGNLS